MGKMQEQMAQLQLEKEKADASKRVIAQAMRSLTGLQVFSLQAIPAATRDFHDDFKIGGGGFGAVSRCDLPLDKSRVPRTRWRSR